MADRVSGPPGAYESSREKRGENCADGMLYMYNHEGPKLLPKASCILCRTYGDDTSEDRDHGGGGIWRETQPLGTCQGCRVTISPLYPRFASLSSLMLSVC